MMRTILLATAAVLIASPALATGNGPPPFQGGNATANAAAAASASAAAKAFQAQHQTQSTRVDVRNTNVNANVARGGNARATGGNAAANATGLGGAGGQGGNSGPVSVNVEGSRDRSYAVGLGGYAAASGPCIGVSTSAGLTVLGVGAQGGRTELEDECQVREAARIAASVGMVGLAQDLIRSLPSVRKALASLEPPAPAPTAATTTQRTAAAPAAACSGVWRNGVMPTGC